MTSLRRRVFAALGVLVSSGCLDGKPDGSDSAAAGGARVPPGEDEDLDGDGHVGRWDCDESNPKVHRGHPELCDGVDNDCNGLVDDVLGLVADLDGDGWGDPDAPVLGCEAPEHGVVEEGGRSDCDDRDPAVNPGAEDVCFDGVDQDCDGRIGCLEATLVDERGQSCVILWRFGQSFYGSGRPCVDCSFDFWTRPDVESVHGESSRCGAAEIPGRWDFSVGPGTISTVDGPLVGAWAAEGSWTDERFVFAASDELARDGVSRVSYRGEVGLREIEPYISGDDGRPFTVRGEKRQPLAVSRRDWSAPLGRLGCVLAPSQRREAAAAWLRMARAEHAAVAAFARFSLDLLTLGAPPELVRDAHAAAADEVRHAQQAFAVAGLLARAPVGPGPLDTAGCLSEATRESIFRRLLREGCIGETVSAVVVHQMCAAATVGAVRGILAGIADDEARHAVLAWRAARWMVGQWPELRTVVVQERAGLGPVSAASRPHPHPQPLRAWGVLSSASRARVAGRVTRSTVVPALDRLAALAGAASLTLASPPTPAR